MSEKTILQFETYLFGLKESKKGIINIPKEYYELTNERLKITKQGVITKDIKDIELYKIQDINVKQKLTDKALGVGDIEIISSDTNNPVLLLKRIKDPHDVREKIRAAVKEARRNEGIVYKREV